MSQTTPIRVLLADDHAIVRKGIREFLEEDGEIVVVAEASDGAEAVRFAGEHRPAVSVLDIQMPHMTGIEATRQIKAAYPDVRVLILTAYEDDPYIFALLRARRRRLYPQKCQSRRSGARRQGDRGRRQGAGA